MKKLFSIAALVVFLNIWCAAQSPWDQIRQKAANAIKNSNGSALSNDKIVAGLKEALTVSTANAVASTGRTDGFLKNEAIKILLPPKLRNAGSGLRLIGMGSEVDALEVGMNRAAEQAAPAAKKIFIDAVTQMSFADARQILSGGDSSATDYFRRQCSDQLTEAFAPIVHQALENVGVVRQYNQFMRNTVAASLANKQGFNLDDYVVGKTMDGLFYVMAEEEKKIRQDPMAQTSALLREVFGANQGTGNR